MKKVINYLLLSTIMVTFLPYSALAETTNVGVKITGETSIEVVTTISTDITLDLTTGNTTPTYMEIQNNSLVPVSAKITNISTTSEGAPSTFVGFDDKDWMNLSKTETKKYVNFNILGEGQDVSSKDILPNTEVNLGTILVNTSLGADTCSEFPCYMETAQNNEKFRINANFGTNWDSGDKNFTYKIETVYSQADEYVETEYSMPSFLDNINITDLSVDISNCDNTRVCSNNEVGIYLNLISSQTSDEILTKLEDGEISISIYVNGKYTRQYDSVQKVDSGYKLKFYGDTLDSGNPHYLTIRLSIWGDKTDYADGSYSYSSGTTFTFIKKVIVYSGE